MSFEYIIEKDSEVKTLTVQQEAELVKSIVDEHSRYEDKRSSNLKKSESVIDEVFFKNKFSYVDDKSERWKSKIKMCKCYMFYQTLKAFIWKNIYYSVNSMFDVSGENHDSDNNSNKQKSALVDMLEKMEYQKTCDKVIDNALLYGELISFTGWKKKFEEYRRPIDFFKTAFSKDALKLPEIVRAIKEGKNYWIDTKKVYDNPYIYPVSPADLVFDVSQVDNWDNCPKIYRTFKTPDEIISNKFYTVSKSDAVGIRALISDSNDIHSQKKDNLKDEIVNGTTVEVLEHWGDLRLPNGEVLKNWHAVVVGRKYLVRFQKNESIINPFSYGAFITDPETKRGISPLYCVIELSKTQEGFLNRTVDMQSLSETPPLLAPEGFFEDEEIKLYPGKIIEYGDNLSSANAFQQLSFNNNVFLADIEFIDTLMCEVSGIYPSMIGIQENSAKTATEINTKTQGQLTRLAMMLDVINQDFVIPCVKNIAKLAADFKQGEETVYVTGDNSQETIIIDDDIRQADYKYTYSDRSMLNDKSIMADLVVQTAGNFAQAIPLDMAEIFTWYFEQKGVENPERFLDQEQLQLMKQAEKFQMSMQQMNLNNQVNNVLSGIFTPGVGVNGVGVNNDIQTPSSEPVLGQTDTSNKPVATANNGNTKTGSNPGASDGERSIAKDSRFSKTTHNNIKGG